MDPQQNAPPSTTSILRLFRVYNPPKDRTGDTLPGAKRMNLHADAVLHRALRHREGVGAVVPSLTMAINGEWIVDAVGSCVSLIPPHVNMHIERVERKDWDVTEVELSLRSDVLSAPQLVELVEGMVEEYVSFQSNELGCRLYFFDQKERQDFRGTPFDDSDDDVARRRFEVMNAPKHLSFLKLPFHSNKTFGNLCGPEAALLFKRVDFFVRNREWYDRKGVPYQLGVMLSGESGTGKSSCIRAIANHTRRHIVNVNFANIRTATQLKKLFYSEELHVYQNDDLVDTVKLHVPVHQRIYVLEELDAIGGSVLERSVFHHHHHHDTPQTSSSRPQTSPHPDPRIPDELTLADVLQVLDGNMETPGRIVIVTSNYPDVLDQALIRPGRIDMQVRFAAANNDTVADIYEKLCDVSFPRERLSELPDGGLSPADVSEVVLRNFGATTDTMIAALRTRAISKTEETRSRTLALQRIGL